MATRLNNGLVGFTRNRIGLRASRGSASAGRLTHASMHHGGDVGGYRMRFASAQRTIKSWQNYHMDVRGWNDIGYNLLMDGLGRVYQGRPVGTLPAAVGNNNSNSVALAFLQDGRHYPLNPLQRRTLKILFQYGIPKWNLPPLRTLSVKGHNEYLGHFSNECPGRHISRHLRWRRSQPNRP